MPWVASLLHSCPDSSGLLSPDDEAVGDLVEEELEDDDEGSSAIEEVVAPTVETLGRSW